MVNTKNFNVIVCTGDVSKGNKGFITYRKQTSFNRFRSFCNREYPSWRFMTVYDRKTNEKEVIINQK
jgi:hypothetical protein